eukprot:1976342-Prymnesium_polylepis.1
MAPGHSASTFRPPRPLELSISRAAFGAGVGPNGELMLSGAVDDWLASAAPRAQQRKKEESRRSMLNPHGNANSGQPSPQKPAGGFGFLGQR